MIKLRYLILCLLFCSFYSCHQNSCPDVPLIILDTDFGPDYDDVGAVAFLHCAADKGEARILSTIVSNRHSLAAPCLDIVNMYYNRSDIPIGAPKKGNVNIGSWENWLDTIYANYPHRLLSTEDVPDAVEVYRRILSESKNKSVTIVTIGFFTNLFHLLESLPDQYSELSGADLVKLKVRKLVSMAGEFPNGYETNIKVDSKASKYVVENWPTEFVFSGAEIGRHVKTGVRLIQDTTIIKSPVKDIYAYVMSRIERDRYGRSSYDQTAVLHAIYGCNPFFEEEKGTFVVDEEGHNSWIKSNNGKHTRLILKSDSVILAAYIEDKMMHKPSK